MNARSAPGLAIAAILLAVGTLGGCRNAAPAAPLAGAALGGPFALVGEDGRPVTDRAFAGRYRAVYFGYTFCPDVCPTTLQKLMAGYRAFAVQDPAAARRLAPIFVSVDPARDTPAVLRTYTDAFGPELVGLTGTPAELKRIARAYGVSFTVHSPAEGGKGYLVDHSSQVILFGPDGAPIALVPTDEGAPAVAKTFADFVR